MNRILVASALCATFSAHAVEFTQLQMDRSAITFTYQQMGVAVDGQFRRFSSQLHFDPTNPTAARVRFDVDLASIDTGAAEGDQEVAGKSWFNTAAFPSARFVSSAVKPLGGDRYAVSGQLTIKGKTRELIAPATFSPQGKHAVFDGHFTLRRADFAIGEGSWAKFDIVANDVTIKFRITASGK